MAGKHTFVNALEKNSKYIGDQLAVVQGQRSRTFKALDDRANQLGRVLASLSIQREERIALGLTNSIEFVESTYGAWKCACISVPLNYRFMDDELVHVLTNSDSVAAIIEQEYFDTFLRIQSRVPQLRFLLVVGDIPTNTAQNIYNYEQLINLQCTEKPALGWKEQTDQDIGYNIYTGGTTGMPKGISYNEKAMIKSTIEAFSSALPNQLKALSKASPESLGSSRTGKLLASPLARKLLGAQRTARIARWVLERIPLSYNRFAAQQVSGALRVLVVSPMMHSLGWVLSFSLPKLGATLYLLESNSYDSQEALAVMQRHKINFLGAIGDATLKPLLNELNRNPYDLSELRGIFASGMPTSAAVKEALLKKHMLNTLFIDFIGGSELTGMAFKIYTSKDTEFNKASFPVTDRIMIVNSQTGKPVAPGEIGELARRTDNLPNGYYKDQEKTDQLIQTFQGQSWLMSGDLAQLDERGFFHFVGRGSECINTGGEKVYPEEVENLLRQISGIKEVGLTATPSNQWGELVTAVVQLQDASELTAQQIIDFTQGKISGYKRPKRVIFTDQFPITLIGKPHYRALRELAKSSIEDDKASQKSTDTSTEP